MDDKFRFNIPNPYANDKGSDTEAYLFWCRRMSSMFFECFYLVEIVHRPHLESRNHRRVLEGEG